EKEAFIKSQDFEKAAKMRDKERETRDKLEAIKNKWSEERDKVSITIGYEEIAHVISQWTKVPLVRLEEKESKKLLMLEDHLKESVIGQEEAINSMARAIRRSRAGIKDPRRPIGSFIFLGPTGVGKTLLAQTISEFMFGGKESLIQIDMSEYMDKFNVSRLIGAPPGYVGYEEGGQLTEKVRRRPYSVVLLDEIEKAHPDVFNLLLQVFEEGRLTDSLGRKVDFRNTIILMTSNVGAHTINTKGGLGFAEQNDDVTYEQMKDRLLETAKKTFKPEFLNRIDEIIVFKSLNRENLKKIVQLEIKGVLKRLQDKEIEVELSADAFELIIEKGFDPVYGARPLKRTIQRLLEDPLAEEIISGAFKEGSKVKADRKEEVLVFQS
ncbi:MAG: AAA family ATPase, partial [Candidatus Omnitrophica bacterium]|nr:AAA family ATPase [Candidatus Omnitrophota bacterium]